MSGNHYLDAGPGYGFETRRDVEAQAASDKAARDLAWFDEMSRKFANMVLETAEALGVERSGYWLDWLQKNHPGKTFDELVRETIAEACAEHFNLPDPDEAYEDARRGC